MSYTKPIQFGGVKGKSVRYSRDGIEKRRRRKERKKNRKEENKEEKEVGLFSYLGFPCLGAIQWPWSLALTLELVQKQFGTNCVSFWVHLVPENSALEQVE